MTRPSPAMLYFAKQRFAMHPAGSELRRMQPGERFFEFDGRVEKVYPDANQTVINAYVDIADPGAWDAPPPEQMIDDGRKKLAGSLMYHYRPDVDDLYVDGVYVVPELRNSDIAIQMFGQMIQDYPNRQIHALVINFKLKPILERYNEKVRQQQEQSQQQEQPAQVAQPPKPQPVPQGQMQFQFSKLARPRNPGSDQLQFSIPEQAPDANWGDRNPDGDWDQFFQGRYDDGFKFLMHSELPEGFKMWPVVRGAPHHGEIAEHYDIDTDNMFRKDDVVPGVVASGYMNTLGGDEVHRAQAKQLAQQWMAANAPDWTNVEDAEHGADVDPWGEFGSGQQSSDPQSDQWEPRSDQCPECGAHKGSNDMHCYNCDFPFPPSVPATSSVHQAAWGNRLPWLIMSDGEVRIGNPGTMHWDIGAGDNYENASVRGIINLDKRPDYSDAVQVYWNRAAPHDLKPGEYIPDGGAKEFPQLSNEEAKQQVIDQYTKQFGDTIGGDYEGRNGPIFFPPLEYAPPGEPGDDWSAFAKVADYDEGDLMGWGDDEDYYPDVGEATQESVPGTTYYKWYITPDGEAKIWPTVPYDGEHGAPFDADGNPRALWGSPHHYDVMRADFGYSEGQEIRNAPQANGFTLGVSEHYPDNTYSINQTLIPQKGAGNYEDLHAEMQRLHPGATPQAHPGQDPWEAFSSLQSTSKPAIMQVEAADWPENNEEAADMQKWLKKWLDDEGQVNKDWENGDWENPAPRPEDYPGGIHTINEYPRVEAPSIGQYAGSNKPLLLVDVDGVLNALESYGYSTTKVPKDYQAAHVNGYHLNLSEQNSQRMAVLGQYFDLMWATAWEHSANQFVSPLHGMPALPVMEFDRNPLAQQDLSGYLPQGKQHEFFKTQELMDFGQENIKPIAFIDDCADFPEIQQWAKRRTELGVPTLALGVNPTLGLTDADTEHLINWAKSLGSWQAPGADFLHTGAMPEAAANRYPWLAIHNRVHLGEGGTHHADLYERLGLPGGPMDVQARGVIDDGQSVYFPANGIDQAMGRDWAAKALTEFQRKHGSPANVA